MLATLITLFLLLGNRVLAQDPSTDNTPFPFSTLKGTEPPFPIPSSLSSNQTFPTVPGTGVTALPSSTNDPVPSVPTPSTSVPGVTWTGPGTGTGEPTIISDLSTIVESTGTGITTDVPISTGAPMSTGPSSTDSLSTTDGGIPTLTTSVLPTGTDSPSGTTDPAPSTTWDPFLVESTSTDPPPDMSTLVQTNTEWKKNFWLSTTGSDGKPTEVPVIHCGCICRGTCDKDEDDDDKFIWVIFWNIPKIPSVQFSFPKLPDFHFPTCVKVLGIKLGSCPPESDNGSHGHKDPDDPNDRNKLPDDPDDPEPSGRSSTAPQSTTESSASSSSSSSSCSASVVTDWVTETFCPSTAASATECTTTSSSSLRTGCSITGTATATFTASNPSCPLGSYVAAAPGVGYSQDGFSYGTYAPPTIPTMEPNTTTGGGGSSTAAPTTGPVSTTDIPTSTDVPVPTTFDTVVLPSDSTTEQPPETTETPPSTTEPPPVSTEESSSPPPPESTAPPPLPPKPEQGLTCFGTDTKKWMSRDAMNNAIGNFCTEAEAQGGHDAGSGSLRREYNGGSIDHVVISIDWPQEIDYKPSHDECVDRLSRVMDSCDGNDPGNPLNWKHGGHNVVDWNTYNIFPYMDDRYKPGVCSYHIHEIEEWEGVDSPGFSRTWWFYVSVQAKDGNGDVVSDTGGKHYEAADKKPYNAKGLYADLVMTPESRNGDYIQFALGAQSWTSKDKHKTDEDKNVVPGCNVGGFDSDYSPAGRDMDCFVQC